MDVIVTLAISLRIKNVVDLEDKSYLQEWYRKAMGQMMMYPEATYIKVKSLEPEDIESPEVPRETAPRNALESEVASLLESLQIDNLWMREEN